MKLKLARFYSLICFDFARELDQSTLVNNLHADLLFFSFNVVVTRHDWGREEANANKVAAESDELIKSRSLSHMSRAKLQARIAERKKKIRLVCSLKSMKALVENVTQVFKVQSPQQ